MQDIQESVPENVEQEKIIERDTSATAQIKEMRRWYQSQEDKLKDPALKLEDLEDEETWQNAEDFPKHKDEVFANQTEKERQLDFEETYLANKFRDARLTEIARRKLEKKVEEVLNDPLTLEEKMERLTPEQHRKLFEKLMQK